MPSDLTTGSFDELMAPPRDTTLLNVFPGSGGNGKLSMEGKTAAAGVDRRLDDCEASTAAPTKAPTVAPTKAPVSACAASLNLKIDDIDAAKAAKDNATLVECVSEWDTSITTTMSNVFYQATDVNSNLNGCDV